MMIIHTNERSRPDKKGHLRSGDIASLGNVGHGACDFGQDLCCDDRIKRKRRRVGILVG